MNKLVEMFSKLPTGGKVALAAGGVGIVIYIWKSKGTTGSATPMTATLPSGDVYGTGGASDGTSSSGSGSLGGGQDGGFGSGGFGGDTGGGIGGQTGGGTVTPTPVPTHAVPTPAPVNIPVVIPTTPVTVTPGMTQYLPTTPHTAVGSLISGTPIILNPSATQQTAPADTQHVVDTMSNSYGQAASNVVTQTVGYQSTNKWSNTNGTYFVADKSGKVVQTFKGGNALAQAQAAAKKVGGKSLEYALPGQ